MALTEAQRDRIRDQILAEPRGRNPVACCWLMERILGFSMPWYVRLWVRWMLTYPRTINEAKRGIGKSFAKVGIDVYRILCNFNVRIVTISKTDEAACELNAPVRAILESNEVLVQVFGKFVGRSKWTDGGLTIAQRTDALIPEATLAARGIETQLARTHWDHIWIDDGQDEDRAESEVLTERDWKWLFTTLRGALLERGTIHVNATPYTRIDLINRLEDWVDQRTGEVRAEAFHIEDVRAGCFPLLSARWMILKTPAILRDGSSIDPARFPLEDRIDPDGVVVEGLHSLRGTPGFETQQLMERPPKVEPGALELVFKKASLKPWARRPDVKVLRIGQYIDPSWVSAQDAARRGSRDRDPDYFAVATLGRDPAKKKVYVLDLVQDRLDVLEKLRRAAALRAQWQPHLMACEQTNLTTNLPGAQQFYKEIAAAVGMPVRFDKPQKSKIARAEIGIARACLEGQVEWNPEILGRPEVVEQLIRFGDPELEHDDMVDALSGAYLLLCGPRPARAGRYAAQFTAAPATVESRFSAGAPAAGGAARAGGNRFSRPR